MRCRRIRLRATYLLPALLLIGLLGVSASVRAQLLPRTVTSSMTAVELTPPEAVWSESDSARVLQSVRDGRISPSQAVTQLNVWQDRFAGQVDYDYLLGSLAVQAEDWSLALEALERVVLINPRFAGAWLDLAIVQDRLGDRAVALEMLQHVRTQFEPQGALLLQIQEAERVIRQRILPREWTIETAVYGGYVRNANAGLSELQLSLTPPGSTPVPIRLASSEAARADFASMWRIQAYRGFTHGAYARSELLLTSGGRLYSQEHDHQQADAGALWVYTHSGPGSWFGQLMPAWRQIWYGGQALGTSAQWQAAVGHAWGSCQGAGSVEWEQRHYQLAGYYNALTTWVGGRWRCQNARSNWALGYRYGWDHPQGARPGGLSHRQEAWGQWQQSVGADGTWSTTLYHARNRDQDMYSELLAHGQARWVRRWGLRVGFDWNLATWGARDWTLMTLWDQSQDQSNIPIARLQDRQIWLGVRYRWQ